MSLALNLIGMELVGVKRPGTWYVHEKRANNNHPSGGNFCGGYIVKHSDGTEAFLKASDLETLTTDTGNLLERMLGASLMQTFEREILEYCKGNNMDRVVVPIDYGDKLEVYNGVQQPLFWIVFELAEHDARVQMIKDQRLDFSWALNAMHNLSTAIRQLHSAKVSHNDVRPSNLLIFDDLLQKLGDLGQATSVNISAPHDDHVCPGDSRYAAPEIIYSSELVDGRVDFNRRRASDLYLLGSMGYFFVTGTMITPDIVSRLLPMHQPPNWTGDFEGVLPYWREVYARCIVGLERKLPTDSNGDLTNVSRRFVTAISELCEPDPKLRGHPRERIGNRDQYSVERYISLFNTIRKMNLN